MGYNGNQFMKKLFLSFVFCLACMISVQAERVLIDGLYYDLNRTSLSAVVTYKSTTASEQASYVSGAVVIPSTVTYNSVTYRVREIGAEAFSNCTQMTKLTIEPRVISQFETWATLIINHAICYNCSNLTEVVIEGNPVVNINGSMHFQNCVSLTDFTCDGSATGLLLKFNSGAGSAMFATCTSLQTIDLPRGMNRIPDNCFYGCGSLTQVTMGGDYAGAYYDYVNQEYVLYQIGDYAFENCNRLSKVFINNTSMLPTITANTFANMPATTQIVLNCACYNYYRTSMIWRDLNLAANLPDFIIESEDDSKGAVSIVKAPECSDGSARITAAPNAGYVFVAWTDANNGNLVYSSESDLSLNDTQTASGLHLIANWTEANCENNGTYPYQFDVENSDESKGSVVVVHYPDCEDGSASMRASAYAGYAFIGWTDALNGNLLVSSESELTLSADYINKDMRLIANWDEANCWTNGVFPYRLEIESADPLKGAVALHHIPDCDDPSALISAAGYAGFAFEAWVDANNGNLIYSNEAITYIVNVDRDLHLVAHFKEASCESNGTFPYSFNVYAADNNMGTIETTAPSCDDKSARAYARPNTGYEFVIWSDGTTENPRNWSEVNQNVNICALFKEKDHDCQIDGVLGYMFKIEPNDYNMGTTMMTRIPDCADPSTQIAAIAKEGFEFVRWSDGDQNAMRTLTVTGDTYLQAIFQDPANPISGIEEVMTRNSDTDTQKLIIDGALYILHEGQLYDARGARVK